jgi:hypothetical protein
MLGNGRGADWQEVHIEGFQIQQSVCDGMGVSVVRQETGMNHPTSGSATYTATRLIPFNGLALKDHQQNLSLDVSKRLGYPRKFCAEDRHLSLKKVGVNLTRRLASCNIPMLH